MRGLFYWMAFQMLVGIWLFVAPFALGFKELTGAAVNNMIFGASVFILGLGVSLYEYYHGEAALPRMEHGEHTSSA